MGLLSSLAPVRQASAVSAMTSAEYDKAFFSGEPVPEPWLGGRFGGFVSPELALTLTYVYSAVAILSDDFGTMTCQGFENTGDDSKERIRYADPGIGSLARKLRWQPNAWQTAKGFWSTMAWQFLLRRACYAEIVYRPGLGFVDQLVPRHPDRVREERLPNGRIRFRLLGEPGGPRFLTQDEMFVVRNTSSDGLNAISRLEYAGRALSTGLSLQEFTHNYFKKGATAALIASYKGDQDDELEVDLHASITRYMSGPENAGGVLLVPADIDVKALGVDPKNAELIQLKNLSGRDVARLFKMPPSWLGIDGTSAGYGSQVQDSTNYVNRCQVPMCVEFEQAIQRDLVLAVDRYFFKFNMDYLLRADFNSRMEGYAKAIQSRVMWPSEARRREDMNPDPKLDALSEMDNRPGSPAVPGGAKPAARASDRKQWLAVAASAVTCVRRERAIVSKLAVKHANDPAGWKAALQEFYGEHAQFIARQMPLDVEAARAYAAQHGAQFESRGVAGIDGETGEAWQRQEAAELADLALSAAEAA